MTTRIFSRFLSVAPIIGLIINILGMQIPASVWPANGTPPPERSLTGYAFQIPLDVKDTQCSQEGNGEEGDQQLAKSLCCGLYGTQAARLYFFSGERESTCLSNIHLAGRRR